MPPTTSTPQLLNKEYWSDWYLKRTSSVHSSDMSSPVVRLSRVVSANCMVGSVVVITSVAATAAHTEPDAFRKSNKPSET